MGLKILHIAPFNTSGVPITFVRAERRLGHTSRLITLGKDKRNYEEDICLDLPLLGFWGTRLIKKLVSHPSKLAVSNQTMNVKEHPLEWRPNGFLEYALVKFRERLWTDKIAVLMKDLDFWNFDLYQLDGGLEFYRDGRTIQKLKAFGKKVVCCYTGSDLRVRGVIPRIDEMSDLNVTLEFDHLQIHPNIHHVFFPFEVDQYKIRPEPRSHTIRIGHAPTNRQAKGSDKIIAVIKELQSDFPTVLVLIENVSHKESLAKKSQCHIFVDQVGDLGYGLNSLEALAMGIPTCSCLVTGFKEEYPDHPFVVLDKSNIKNRLIELITKPNLRHELGIRGRAWVEKYHKSENVVEAVHRLAGLDKKASLSNSETVAS